ncbi:hypothetical protein [Halosimplex salinum]|uniref:hypothetical protein n=1 Tax=Halosimplex salinum TaxID=1710538 RepID=UPI000F488FE5|nr:hypothetical protein [Halosimplex salinum]
MTDRQLRNTRRTFLASSAVGALAGIATTGSAGETVATRPNPDFTIHCSTVTVDDWDTTYWARVVFRDGSYVRVGQAGPDEFGAPGRVVDTVTFYGSNDEELTVSNDSTDCDPEDRAVTFTDSRVTVRGSEFVDIEKPPDNVISKLDLHFVDGTTQNVYQYDGPPKSVADVYRGTGEHDGKVIEAFDVDYNLNDTRHYIRNPAADKHLLGKEDCQDRCIEVMGATEGAVDYEFTVDGPIRAVSLSDRRNASPGGNDAITDNGDGTWTATGRTGNPGYGDTYAVEGQVQSFTQTGGSGDYVLRECEWRILEDTSPSTDLLAVVATESGDVDYEFIVDGTARGIPNVGDRRSAAGNDQVTDNGDGTVTVDGFTGNEGYGDTYAVTGDVTDFQRTAGDADFRIEYNGHELTPTELVNQQ